MDVIFTHCAGLDVHKKTVMTCRVTPDSTGQQADGIMELRQFETMTCDLLALSDWLAKLMRYCLLQASFIPPQPRRELRDLTRYHTNGSAESAGKQRSGKTRRGDRTLRTGLTHMAHAAARTKGTYLSALYQCLAACRGKKRALTAVAYAIVVSAFHMLSRQEPYRELGANYFDAQRHGHLVDRLTRRIEHLGYHVHLEPVQAS